MTSAPGRWLALGALLLGLAIVNFYFPMRQHFWGGGDEHILFTPWTETFWSTPMDQFAGRPLALVQVGVARLLTPGRIDGFLLLALALCWANGLLLAAILRCFFSNFAMPLLGAALLIVNPCDTSRYYVIWTSNGYWMTVLFLQTGIWLFLNSAARECRWTLAGACLALLAAGLSNEGVLPLAALAPGLLWLTKRGRTRLRAWTFAWYVTLAFMVLRFLHHLCFDEAAYQGRLLNSLNASDLLDNALLQLGSIKAYVIHAGASHRFYKVPWIIAGLTCLAGCVAACVAVGFQGRHAPSQADDIRRHALGAVVAALAVACGTLPYVIVPGLFRTQFLAGPGQAALLACVIGTLAAAAPRWLKVGVGAGCAGWIIGVTTMAAWQNQERAARDEPASFAKVVAILDRVQSHAPRFVPGTLLLFVVDGPHDSPVGPGYALDAIVHHLFDGTLTLQFVPESTFPAAAAAQGTPSTSSTQIMGQVAFLPDGVHAQSRFWGERSCRYDELVLFRLDRTGALTLLQKIPDSWLPTPHGAAAYAPSSRILPGPRLSLPYYCPLLL